MRNAFVALGVGVVLSYTSTANAWAGEDALVRMAEALEKISVTLKALDAKILPNPLAPFSPLLTPELHLKCESHGLTLCSGVT
jgi:hypothetical protein